MPFIKGHPGYKKVGTKHKDTLLKEERRAVFDQEVSKMFLDTIKKAPPAYLLDQFLGKSPDKIEHTIEEKNIDQEARMAAAKAYAETIRNAGRN